MLLNGKSLHVIDSNMTNWAHFSFKAHKLSKLGITIINVWTTSQERSLIIDAKSYLPLPVTFRLEMLIPHRHVRKVSAVHLRTKKIIFLTQTQFNNKTWQPNPQSNLAKNRKRSFITKSHLFQNFNKYKKIKNSKFNVFLLHLNHPYCS